MERSLYTNSWRCVHKFGTFTLFFVAGKACNNKTLTRFARNLFWILRKGLVNKPNFIIMRLVLNLKKIKK